MTETINGLHRCQPKNVPTVGQVKNFAVIHIPATNDKKAWIKIKSEAPEKGGSPYRVVSITDTGWEPDAYGNVSLNIEIEPAVNGQQGAQEPLRHPPQTPSNVGYAPPARPYAETVGCATPKQDSEDGVTATRKHLMQVANLMLLAIKATDYVMDNVEDKMRTPEQAGQILGQIFRESYGRRTNDGVNWWSYVDLMPQAPLKP